MSKLEMNVRTGFGIESGMRPVRNVAAEKHDHAFAEHVEIGLRRHGFLCEDLGRVVRAMRLADRLDAAVSWTANLETA